MAHPISGLFYCQYLIGIGHLVRSLHLCRSLIKTFEIDFLLGGYDLNISLKSPHFHPLYLTPMDVNDTRKSTEEVGRATEEKFSLRREFIDKLNKKYDFLFIELFPFSKLEFRKEVEFLIQKVKSINPDCLILCSLRDSFTKKRPEAEELVLKIFLDYFDYVFVHSDPRVFKLEESFTLAHKIRDKVIYTGFITNPESNILQKRQKRIVVSQGAGTFGEELFEAVVRAAADFPDYQFCFIIGPKSSPALAEKVASMAQEVNASNVQIQPFVENFPEYLSASALSISLGGYTIIDAVYTKTPAIILPWGNLDQYVRAIKFGSFGYLKMISVDQLPPPQLSKIIHETLAAPLPIFPIEMSGAQTTCRELERLFEKR